MRFPWRYSDYTYDSLNRLTQLREFKDNNANGVWDAGVDTLLSEYDYTLLADGKRASVTETDAGGNTTTIDWLYDNLGSEKGTSLILTRRIGDGRMAPCHEPREQPKAE